MLHSPLLSPTSRYLFFSDWGRNAKIERSSLAGRNCLAIVTRNLGWPNGLTIDFKTNKLYWGDAKLDKISRCNFDGAHIETIVGE